MSLAIRKEVTEVSMWNNDNKLAQIKEIYGKNLTQGEFETFVQLGKATRLNPFLREIWAVKYGNNPAQIFIGRDGYRRSAQAHRDYDYHHVDAIYTNDNFHFDVIKGEVHHTYNVNDRGTLIGAYSLVKKRNSSRPIYVYIDVKEYNKGQSVWKEKPATMIKKVAEAQCLRMAFQELFAGTYDESEAWEHKPKYVKPVNVKEIKVEEIVIENNIEEEAVFETILEEIQNAESLERLQDVFKEAKGYNFCKDKIKLNQIITAKDKRKIELQLQSEDEVL